MVGERIRFRAGIPAFTYQAVENQHPQRLTDLGRMEVQGLGELGNALIVVRTLEAHEEATL